jgi:S1-C subfamily serine protease
VSETLGQILSNCVDAQESLRILRQGLHEATRELQDLQERSRAVRKELCAVHDQVEQLGKDWHESAPLPPLPGSLEPAETAISLTEKTVSEAASPTESQPGPQGKAALGITVDPGAKVVEVLPGTPAEKAGLRPGDVLLGIDGKPTTTSEELLAAIGRADAGTEIRLQIARGEHTEEVTVQLADSSGAASLHDRLE